MFLAEMEGTLMELSEAPETRYRYVVWFDYTRRAINEIQEGTLLAVPNFASDSRARHYSVLEVTTFLPLHYALEAGTGGYPGFVVEAARSAAADWEAQDTESTEDTTKIRAVAIPTGLEIVEPDILTSSGTTQLVPESNMAMVGSPVKVLDTEYTNLVANNGIDQREESNLAVIGTMARNDQVEVLVRIEGLYRTHFAIFGFTGVGKSNLLSTIVAKVLANAGTPLKLVFFDLMSEYTVLLLDQLLMDGVHGRILTIGRHTLPEGLFQYINDIQGAPSQKDAVEFFDGYTLLPKALLRHRSAIRRGLDELLSRRVIRFYHEAKSTTVYDFFFSAQTQWGKKRQQEKYEKRKNIAKAVLKGILLGANYRNTVFTPDLARRIREGLERELESDATFAEDYSTLVNGLHELEVATSHSYAAASTLDELVRDLNDPGHSSLWVVQAHNPDELRAFSKRLGEALYEERRKTGRIDPLVSFVFDEADEFIRRDGSGSYKDSAEIAQTLARRGRKFGLGLGIATQRIRYLDTNIMAQPHTYFISKLPRLSDRQAVAEAFGVSEELLNQTFKFKKGEWLLISHDATGLEAIPLPIKTPDANVRISEWLRERYGADI